MNQKQINWSKNIGTLQKSLPAHVANEYCRRDRSFSPMPDFKEKILPRPLDCPGIKNWYDEPKLGLNFAIIRGDGGFFTYWGKTGGPGLPINPKF